MSTTSVIVEHLLAGILALVAVILGLLGWVGYGWIDWGALENHQAMTTGIALAIAYPLGIAVDEISDQIGKGWRKWTKSKCRMIEERPQTLFQLMARHNNETLRAYFDYTRGRQRMLRSAALTLPVCTLAGGFFLVRQVPGWRWEWLFSELAAGSLLSLVCLWAASIAGATFLRRKKEAFDALDAKSD